MVLLLTEFTAVSAAPADTAAVDWQRDGRDEGGVEVEVESKREECCGGELVVLLGLLGTG